MKNYSKQELEKILKKEQEEYKTLKLDLKIKENTIIKLMEMIGKK